MSIESVVRGLVQTGGRLFLFVLDGLGGLPGKDGLTELEAARTPHMDELARSGSVGLLTPIAPGITPGSAPAHLALFGYDPIAYQIGRGVLSAVGVGLRLGPKDVAARINFCTLDGDVVVDRRAGRIPTELTARLCEALNEGIQIPGIEVQFEPEMQHRAVMVLRGEGLHPALSDTDPQVVGKPPLPVRALEAEAQRTAELVNQIVAQAREILKGQDRANGILVRGFGQLPHIPSLEERFGLNPAVIASYPMYRGLAQLVGMTNLPTGSTIEDEVATFRAQNRGYDYVFLHVKGTDAAGEDGDFDRKVSVIEEFDRLLPQLLEEVDLSRDVVVITGDHSTPSVMKSHSWHPVPALLASPYTRQDRHVNGFGERECLRGSLGFLRSQDLMHVMLAHAGRLKKFGA